MSVVVSYSLIALLMVLLIVVAVSEYITIRDLRQDRVDMRMERAYTIQRIDQLSNEVADLRNYLHGRLTSLPPQPEAAPPPATSETGHRKFRVIDGMGTASLVAILAFAWKNHPKIMGATTAAATVATVALGVTTAATIAPGNTPVHAPATPHITATRVAPSEQQPAPSAPPSSALTPPPPPEPTSTPPEPLQGADPRMLAFDDEPVNYIPSPRPAPSPEVIAPESQPITNPPEAPQTGADEPGNDQGAVEPEPPSNPDQPDQPGPDETPAEPDCLVRVIGIGVLCAA